jgi:hypothetical protein
MHQFFNHIWKLVTTKLLTQQRLSPWLDKLHTFNPFFYRFMHRGFVKYVYASARATLKAVARFITK